MPDRTMSTEMSAGALWNLPVFISAGSPRLWRSSSFHGACVLRSVADGPRTPCNPRRERGGHVLRITDLGRMPPSIVLKRLAQAAPPLQNGRRVSKQVDYSALGGAQLEPTGGANGVEDTLLQTQGVEHACFGRHLPQHPDMLRDVKRRLSQVGVQAALAVKRQMATRMSRAQTCQNRCRRTESSKEVSLDTSLPSLSVPAKRRARMSTTTLSRSFPWTKTSYHPECPCAGDIASRIPTPRGAATRALRTGKAALGVGTGATGLNPRPPHWRQNLPRPDVGRRLGTPLQTGQTGTRLRRRLFLLRYLGGRHARGEDLKGHLHVFAEIALNANTSHRGKPHCKGHSHTSRRPAVRQRRNDAPRHRQGTRRMCSRVEPLIPPLSKMMVIPSATDCGRGISCEDSASPGSPTSSKAGSLGLGGSCRPTPDIPCECLGGLL